MITALMPDLMTASGMTALSAFVAAWLLWLRGRLHQDKGVHQAVWAAVFFGFAYVAFAVQVRLPSQELHLLHRIFISAGIAFHALALLRFRQRSGQLREMLVLMLPVAGSLVLAWVLLPQHPAAFNRLQSSVILLQMGYILLQLLHMRGSTPGIGWMVVSIAGCVQAATIVSMVVFGQQFSSRLLQAETPATVVVMWLVCVVLFLNVIVISVGFLMMLRDRQAALEMSWAQRDPLTELSNRSAMVTGLQDVIGRCAHSKRPMALLMVDLDHFKQLNDSHGHLVGDQAILKVSQVLVAHARVTDLVARFGGEEFVVILPDTPRELAGVIAHRLCTAIRDQPLCLASGEQVVLTASIGVHVCIPVQGACWQSLLDAADAAMYVAKRDGRDRVAFSAG